MKVGAKLGPGVEPGEEAHNLEALRPSVGRLDALGGPEALLSKRAPPSQARARTHLTFSWMVVGGGVGRMRTVGEPAWETDHPEWAHREDPAGAALPLSAGARCPLDLPTALRPAPLSLTFLTANGAAACHPHPTPRGRAGRRLAGRARGWS